MVGGADAGWMNDEHGKACPANWRESGKKICGDPIAELDYFVSVDGKHENDKVNGTKRARALIGKSQHVREG